MKKLLALLLALSMVMALVACGTTDDGAATDDDATTSDDATTDDATTDDATTDDATTDDATTDDATTTDAATDRIIVWDNAVLELTSSEQPRGDEMRVAYSFQDVVDKHNITGTDPCQIIGADGYAADEVYEDLMQKYLTMEGEAAPIVVGEAQDPDWAVWQVAYIRLGTDILMTSYQEVISVADVFADVGMVEADSYDFICADGYTHTVTADEIAECTISWVDDRVDATAPGLGDYTLYSILYIQPAA